VSAGSSGVTLEANRACLDELQTTGTALFYSGNEDFERALYACRLRIASSSGDEISS
jgi:hypothetical protein